MNVEASELWSRAEEALAVAEATLALSPDAATSRAYYAAFYAVSALFAEKSVEFRRHSQIQAAVHRDLVHAGLWPTSLGADFTALTNARTIGDYGIERHVSRDEADDAIARARRIVEQVRADLGLDP